MISVILENLANRERIGRFFFAAVPRVGEEVVIPWEGAPEDLRMFTVAEVRHVAAGFPTIGESNSNQVSANIFLVLQEMV